MGRIRRNNRRRFIRGASVAGTIPAGVRADDRRALMAWVSALVRAMESARVAPAVPVVRGMDAEAWGDFVVRAVFLARHRVARRWERETSALWRGRAWLDLGRSIRFSELAESGAVRRESVPA